MAARLFLRLCVGAILLIGLAYSESAYGNAELYSNIYNILAKTNAKRIPPGVLDTANKDVSLSMELIQIVEVDEAHKTLEAILWVFESYNDPRLRWDPTSYGNQTKVVLPRLDIWIPDWEVYNGLEQTHYFGEYPAVAKSDGSVHRVPVISIKIRCDSSRANTYFECGFKFGSWVWPGKELNPVLSESGGTNLAYFAAHPDWNVTSFTAVREEKKYECCEEIYPAIQYSIVLEKRSNCS